MEFLRRPGSLFLATLVGIAGFSVAGWAQGPPPVQMAIDGVIAANTKLEVIKSGGDFGGLEGPTPTPEGGLYFTDTRTSKIWKLDKSGNVTLWREKTNGTNGLYLLKDGRLLAAESTRIVAIMPDGSITPLVTEFEGKPLKAANDLIMDKKGGIYFTDPGGRATKEPSLVLYRRPSGEVVLIDNQGTFPNGLTLSMDQKTLYVGDVNAEHVYAYDIQPDGSVKNKRPFAKLQGFTQDVRTPAVWRSGADGMAIDSKGRLYVTSDLGIQVIDKNGKHLGTIPVPTKARNVAFGGPRRQTLFITGPAEWYRVQMLSEGPSGRPK